MSAHTLPWLELFPYWTHPIRTPAHLSLGIADGPSTQAEFEYARCIENQKKVELHVHTEAAIPIELYKQYNDEYKCFEPNALPCLRTPFENFLQFIHAWRDNTFLIQREAQFAEIAEAFVSARAPQNIVYTEAHFSPLDFTLSRHRIAPHLKPLNLEKTIQNYLSGIKSGQKKNPHIAVRLIVDILWVSSSEIKSEIYSVLKDILKSSENTDEYGDAIIVAVGMGGAETPDHAEMGRRYLDKFRELGLKVDIHCGESASSDDQKRSLKILEPDRIAHGIQSHVEDWYFDKHISVCPLSNLVTGAFKGPMALHPISKMRKNGVNFSVSSDDPLFFSNTLTLEYLALKNAFGWGQEFFEETQSSAKKAVFAPRALERVMPTEVRVQQ